MARKVLIIKLGALGDFVQATAALQDIRTYEQASHITLLTTPAMEAFAKGCPWIDEVVYDERKPFFNLKYVRHISNKLKGYDRVYDLQTSNRSSWYFKLSKAPKGGHPEWCGIAPGCSHPHTNPKRNEIHSLDRLADQLAVAGVAMSSSPNLDYMREDCSDILKKRRLEGKKLAAFIPGGSAHRPEKRWPEEHFIKAIEIAKDNDFTPILIGGKAEEELLSKLCQATGAHNLCGETSLGQLIDMFTKISFVIGNDTGPMQLAATTAVNGVVIFGDGSNPELCAPRSDNITVIHKSPISAITPQEVMSKVGL